MEKKLAEGALAERYSKMKLALRSLKSQCH